MLALLLQRIGLYRAFAIAATLAFASLPARAQELPAVSPDELKAAFVYRLCYFATWPPQPADKPFVIGVVGHSPVEDRLRELTAGKLFNGRAIEILRFDSLYSLGDADAVFVAVEYRRWTERLIARYRERETLLIGEYEDFAVRGGAVAMHFSDGRLALIVNPQAAERDGLSLDAKLMAVAEKVILKR